MNGFYKKQMKDSSRAYRLGLKLQEIKSELLTEAMSHMILRCAPEEEEYTTEQTELVKGLTRNLIHENGGVIPTLSKYRTKSYALSECVKIVNKYYSILESDAKKVKDPDIFTIDVDIKTKFYKELEDMDMEQAEEIISKRVRNNTYDYIKSNLAAKENIAQIIDDTKNKINAELDKGSVSESYKFEQLREAAARKQDILKKSGVNSNIYGIVVNQLAKGAYLDDKIKDIVVGQDNKPDFNLIEKYANSIYAFLEAANGLKMANINKQTLNKFIKTK